jgi:hypothetical protein
MKIKSIISAALLALLAAVPAYASRTIMEQLPASANTIMVATQTVQVGIGTSTPATGVTLDVAGAAQFGTGANKSTFTATGMLLLGVTNPNTYPTFSTLMTGNVNSYFQWVMQNLFTGNAASTDLSLTNDLGSDTSYYLDIGINSSQYSQSAFSAEPSSATYVASSDSDLFLWAGTNGGLYGAQNERLVFGSSNPVTGNIAAILYPATASGPGPWLFKSSVTITAAAGLNVSGPITAGSISAPNTSLTSLSIASTATPTGYIVNISSQNGSGIYTLQGSGLAVYTSTQGTTSITGGLETIAPTQGFAGLYIEPNNASPSPSIVLDSLLNAPNGFTEMLFRNNGTTYEQLSAGLGTNSKGSFSFFDTANSNAVQLQAFANGGNSEVVSLVPSNAPTGLVGIGLPVTGAVYPNGEFEVASDTGAANFVVDVSSQNRISMFGVLGNGTVQIGRHSAPATGPIVLSSGTASAIGSTGLNLGGVAITTITNCGNSVTGAGNGNAGTITVGTSPSTTCSITWSPAYPTGSVCNWWQVSISTVGPTITQGVSSSTATFVGTLTGANKINFHCDGY